MRDRVVIVEIPLNTVNRWLSDTRQIQPQGLAPDRLTPEWIANRLDLFFTFTLPSLRQQTNQDFTAVVLYDPLSRSIIMDARTSVYKSAPDRRWGYWLRIS